MDDEIVWKMIDSYFNNNPQCLVRHHTESYNDFFKNGIFQIFKEKNPLEINTRFDKDINDFRSKCIMYFGGKDGSKIYFGKPIIYDDNNSHYMFPNEARLRNMTYGMTIHYDIEIEFIDILGIGENPSIIGLENFEHEGGYDSDSSDEEFNSKLFKKNKKQIRDEHEKGKEEEDKEERRNRIKAHGGSPKPQQRKRRTGKKLDVTPAENALLREATEKSMINSNTQKRTIILEQIFLGKFPIMVQSDFCILKDLPREVRHTMGECPNDLGGYFIIDGKEKTVISQEKFADNMLYIRDVNDDQFLYSAEIRSVSENVSKPIRTLSVKIVSPSKTYTNKNIVVNIPNIRKPVPLFIVFRALGILSDKQIISMCLLDMDKYESMIDLFIPSVHDAGGVMTQRTALQYLALLTKGKTIAYVLEILSDYFLPHIGETNFIQKAYYLGYVVFRLLSVYTGIEPATDRDNFKYKRLETVGSLMHELFREYYSIQLKQIHLAFEEKISYNESLYSNNLYGLVEQYYKDIFRERTVEIGFKKAFKGNWGAKSHTKRIGVIQDMNRLSFNSALSHLRKTNLPLDASVKIVGPRVLHSTQWGLFDPIDTPDGANIGLHKSLSISTYITKGVSREPMLKWLREKVDMKLLEDCSPQMLANMTKVILNGLWAGSIYEPIDTVKKIKLFRRNALIPIYTSVSFDIKQNTVFIYTDAGRLCRPIIYKDDETGKFSTENPKVLRRIKDDDFKWMDLITGFNERKIENFDPNTYKIYELNELYTNIDVESNPAKLQRFLDDKAVLDYIDTNESENILIAMNKRELEKDKTNRYTHLEIHESLIFGVMCNLINFPENNPATRNSFSCGQSKQAVSMYHTNYQVRMDKTAVVLVSGQTPIVKSRYLEHINQEQNPYGENAIVAIMVYSGYNVEDAILVNEGALKRGLFRTTYYSTYESHEEREITPDGKVEKLFTNIESESDVTGTKPGFDYSKLDRNGLIRENTLVDDKTVLIGLTMSASSMKGVKVDMSKTPKKGQLGVIDKSFITDSEEGKRIAKVRIREERIPNIGDKMASRAGQKGTVGLVIPEEDMPFTKNGLRPDLIINPHAIPSRMTIGQLVECIIGKVAIQYGGFADCTAFDNKGSKIGVFGELLPKVGFHSSGNEILYNGMTGEQIQSEIFIGPNYYMRLKHMVKDKINFRALGPRTALTKQPVAGRANDGGLRIGEMERDSVISHGAVNFLTESMMERGDKYYMAICNNTGMIAIFNPSKNIFMSPMADGPIRYVGSMDGKEMRIENITKFGRSFSVIAIPYTLKLLIQELQTVNIQMRIITDDNIEQLENMLYSKNIDNLLFKETTAKEYIFNVRTILSSDEFGKNKLKTPDTNAEEIPEFTNFAATPSPIEYAPYSPYNVDTSPQYPESPPYAPGSPAYNPESPPYAPGSPAYNPDSPPYAPGSPAYNPDSPPYAPGSPAYNPDSPPYAPGSPAYNPENPDLTAPKKFIAGENVYLRGGGDDKPDRLWKIKNIGDKFVTIVTDDLVGINPQDSIKVVQPYELYKLADYKPTKSPAMRGGFGMIPKQPFMQSGMYGGYSEPQSININPVIKIMNGGSDFSNGQEPINGGTQIEQQSQSTIIPTNMNTGGSGTPIIVKEQSGGGQPPQQNGGGVLDHLFQAGNLLIKKVGL
jgi:DNA-directed RNA polymerase II subunit RPB2